MWNPFKKKAAPKTAAPAPEKEVSLLKELCGDDKELHEFTSNYLCVNPLLAISPKTLDALLEEGDKTGDYRLALDKAIFEASQNPADMKKYLAVIQDIAARTIRVTETQKTAIEKQGLADRAAFLDSRIQDQKLMQKRAEDILNVASKYYHERLLELGEDERREQRTEERRQAENEEWRTGMAEKAEQEARKIERKAMGRTERKEAEKQEQRDELAAQERKTTRQDQRKEAELEDQKTQDREKVEREARKKEIRGS
jgi:hypothetical protein